MSQSAKTQRDDDERRLREIEEAERRIEQFGRATRDLPEANGCGLPDQYSLTPGGVWWIKPGIGPVPVASSPLLITRVYVDPDGRESLEVTWRGRNGWVRRIVARSEVASGAALVKALADSGLPVIASDGTKAERWLSAYEMHNRSAIKVERLARWLGWQPDDVFLSTSGDADRKIEPAWPDQQTTVLAAHRPAGTFTAWRAAVEKLDRFPEATMVLSAAFAAPLLEPLGLRSFMLDICGRSTRGKTTSAKVAASVWGEPSDTGTIHSWQTTLVTAEQRLNLVRGLPVVFDETQLVTNPAIVHKILYSLPMGRGQTRGNGHASALRFQTVLISTGEKSALTFTQEQGAAARALTLARPPFPAGDGHGAIAAALTMGIDENFGHAGPAFVRHLSALLAATHGRQRLETMHADVCAELLADLPPEADIARRRAPNLAALVVAARLAHEWGVVPVPAPPIDRWTSVFQAQLETDNRAEMALEVLRGYLAGHPGELYDRNRMQPGAGWLGRMVETENGAAVAILPPRLKAILSDEGYDFDAVRAMWKDLGYIVTTKERTPTGVRERDQVKKRLNNMPVWLVLFDPKHLNLDGDGDGDQD